MTQAVNIEGVGKVNFPDDYSPERIKFAIENDILPRVKGAKKPAEKYFSQPEEPTRLERLGRGMADVGEGLRQGSGMLRDALPDTVQKLLMGNIVTGPTMAAAKLFAPEDTAAYTKEKTAEGKLYERGRESKGGDPGIDWWRLGGNVAATLPVAAIPGGSAASLPVRMLSGAAQGAVASGSMFAPEGESKGEQIATGAVLGGAIPAVGAGLKKTGSAILEKLGVGAKPVLPETGKISGEISLRLEQKGIDFNKLTSEVQQSLVSDAQKAIAAGGTLDDAMLANKALIESVGAKGTKGAITRNPKDWQTEQNLRGITGVGEPIAARNKEDAAALTTYLGNVRAGTGGKASDAYGAGESAIGAVKALDKEKDAAVGKLYDAFRSSGSQDAAVPAQKVADALGKVADEIGKENIPPAVAARLKEFGMMGEKQTKLLTVNEADKLNRLLNNNNPGNGPGALAVGRLKAALNQALLDVEPSGKQGVEALTTARAAAAKRFAEQDAASGVSAAIKDVAPDRFVKKYILDADARDVRGLWEELGKSAQGKQAQADVKGHIVDGMLLRATGAKTLEDVSGQPFSYARFADALNAIPREKLHTMFSPSEVENLRTLEKASKLLTQEVPFSDVNHSKTTAALANILQRVGNTPVLGQIVSPIIGAGKIGADWVKNANDRKIVADAILGSAAKAGSKPLPKAGAVRFLIGPAGATLSPSAQGADK